MLKRNPLATPAEARRLGDPSIPNLVNTSSFLFSFEQNDASVAEGRVPHSLLDQSVPILEEGQN